MVINDFKEDVLKLGEGKTLTEIGEHMGIDRQYAYSFAKKYINHAKITDKYVELIESLGYDIEVKYVKRMSR